MPRSRSIFIQSERVERRSRLALTWPARLMAPPNSRSFSVSVVLPASGCEMIAKVRRRSTSAASGELGRESARTGLFMSGMWQGKRPKSRRWRETSGSGRSQHLRLEVAAQIERAPGHHEHAVTAIVDGLRIFRRCSHMRLHHLEDEHVVSVAEPVVGKLAFEVGVTLPDERRPDLFRRLGGELEPGKFVDART